MRYLPAILALSLAACGPQPETSGGRDAHCQGIPVVDEAAAKAKDEADRARIRDAEPGRQQGAPTEGQPAKAQDAGQATAAAPSQPSSSARETVKGYIQKLMDVPRTVPAAGGHPAEMRGGPGSFAKLSGDQVEQFITAIIKGGDLFLPKSLKPEEKYALVCAEISIESAFQPGTSGTNPGDSRYVSVGPLQLTISGTPGVPGMWDDTFRQYANIPGLTHFDGSPWDPKTTDNEALKNNIHDGVVAALWCITEQGRRGNPDWFGSGQDGPCPKTLSFAYLGWVAGSPAAREYAKNPDSPAADLAGQREKYWASIKTDINLLGFSESLVDTAF